MQKIDPCPSCKSPYGYEMDGSLVCPECGFQWSPKGDENQNFESREIRDANGTLLNDGDSVLVIKDLPVRGAPKPIKAGTKVKNIRLVEGDHDIECKIPGFGAMSLKSEFVKKIL